MAYNRSSNKIRVVEVFGTGSTVGYLNPAVGMKIRHNNETLWVKTLASGNFTVGLSLTNGGAVCRTAYPHDICIDTPTASGYGWPNGINNPVALGHSGVWPNGIPVAIGSGVSYMTGAGTTATFGRN
jgi:hypothetical protein